jgi:hypothetical protein
MDEAFRKAIENITRYGDTDIFPLPVENHVLFDRKEEVLSLLRRMNEDARASLAKDPPQHIGALAPAGYSGFRWATQLDPVWNAIYLGWVISIAEEIEAVRTPLTSEQVFSYRFEWNETDKTLFKKEIGWRQFIDKAIQKASLNKFVVSCDISEFYPRINHHRLENSIRHLPSGGPVAERIRPFLSNYSNTYSFGLPIGGDASRILAELVLNQVDSLLNADAIDFIRFVDDFYLFADTPAEAFHALVTLTRILNETQGLQLQKSKTRTMSGSEFLTSNPLAHDNADGAIEAPLGEARQAVMKINLHYDPYSSTAEDDYARLQEQLGRFPIIDLIRSELKKTRVNISLTKRLINIVRHLSEDVVDDAALTLVRNEELLYPLYFNVLRTTKSIWSRLSAEAQTAIGGYVYELVSGRSRVMEVDVNLQYAIRLLGQHRDEGTRLLLNRVFRSARSEVVGHDIILIFFNWRDWHWLSALKNRFRSLPTTQRRAYIIASFGLGDEGEQWRNHVKRELSDEEKIVRDWAEQKTRDNDWKVPL